MTTFPLLLAQAADTAPAPAAGSPFDLFLPLGLTIAIVYFLMLRPQQKRADMHRKMIEGLKKGDHVLTSSGIYGRVLEVDKKTVTVDVGNNLKLRMSKSAVASLDKPDEET